LSRHDPSAAVVQRVLPAPPRVVYHEWVDAEALADWMCPLPARATLVECDPSVGGRLRIDIDESGVLVQITGRYLTLEPPHRLAFTWSTSSGIVDSVVTVTLEAHGDDETLMTIEHAPLPPQSLESYRTGWAQIAAQLHERLG
jgi:uncharacterized protein YndB with AHSA1/START domain